MFGSRPKRESVISYLNTEDKAKSQRKYVYRPKMPHNGNSPLDLTGGLSPSFIRLHYIYTEMKRYRSLVCMFTSRTERCYCVTASQNFVVLNVN